MEVFFFKFLSGVEWTDEMMRGCYLVVVVRVFIYLFIYSGWIGSRIEDQGSRMEMYERNYRREGGYR